MFAQVLVQMRHGGTYKNALYRYSINALDNIRDTPAVVVVRRKSVLVDDIRIWKAGLESRQAWMRVHLNGEAAAPGCRMRRRISSLLVKGAYVDDSEVIW
jgi:hypothetical protein